MAENALIELKWKRVTNRGKGTIHELPPNAREVAPVPYRGRLWIVNPELSTYVRGETGWRHLGKQGPKLWRETALFGAEGWGALLLAGDRLIATSGAGRVFELVEEEWTLVHRPDKQVPLWSGNTGWDPAGERIVAWRGGADGASRRSRAARTTTYVFEGGAWRLAFEEKTPDVISKRVVFFDPGLQRIVRAWQEDVGVLLDDGWRVCRPESYEADWQRVLTDPKTGEVLTEHPLEDVTELARLDVGRCDAVATVANMRDEGTGKGFASWYDATLRTVFYEDLGDPRLAFSVDLGPAFEAARKLGPRTQPGAAGRPKASKKK